MSKPQHQPPSVGRIVHVVFGSEHYAALITSVIADQQVTLTVFPPSDPAFPTVAAYDSTGAPGTWHWPELVLPVVDTPDAAATQRAAVLGLLIDAKVALSAPAIAERLAYGVGLTKERLAELYLSGRILVSKGTDESGERVYCAYIPA